MTEPERSSSLNFSISKTLGGGLEIIPRASYVCFFVSLPCMLSSAPGRVYSLSSNEDAMCSKSN